MPPEIFGQHKFYKNSSFAFQNFQIISKINCFSKCSLKKKNERKKKLDWPHKYGLLENLEVILSLFSVSVLGPVKKRGKTDVNHSK